MGPVRRNLGPPPPPTNRQATRPPLDQGAAFWLLGKPRLQPWPSQRISEMGFQTLGYAFLSSDESATGGKPPTSCSAPYHHHSNSPATAASHPHSHAERWPPASNSRAPRD